MVDLYNKPTISGYNSNPPPDDDSTTSDNAVSWSKHVNKLAGPIKALVDSINTGVDTLADSLFGKAVTAQSANFNLATSDYGKLFKTSSAITITLLTGSDAGGNFVFAFYNSDATNNLTLGRNGVNINGAASNLTVYPKMGGIAFSDGTDWWVINNLTPDAVSTISGNWTHTGTVTMSGKSIIEANSSIAAHATTMDPWSLGNYVTLTGAAVTFTAIANAPQAGAEVELYMNAAHTFTDGAVFEVDGDENWTAEIGDRVLLRAKSTTLFTVHPRKKTGTPLFGGVYKAEVATTSGTSATIGSSIPSWVKRIEVDFIGLSGSGTSTFILQIGDSGGLEVTGYSGSAWTMASGSGANSGAGFLLQQANAAAAVLHGGGVLTLENESTNTWSWKGMLGNSNIADVQLSASTKSLTGTLTTLSLTTTGGADTLDAGVARMRGYP